MKSAISHAAKTATELIADYIPSPVSRSLKAELLAIVQAAIDDASMETKRSSTSISIEVSGGVVSRVVCSDPTAKVTIIDHDSDDGAKRVESDEASAGLDDRIAVGKLHVVG